VANSNPSVKPPNSLRPVQDEWGLFDPKQAGVEALVRKLLSATHEADTAKHEQPAPKKSK